MNPVPPLPFPGSRTVAAWWRELARYGPSRLWLAHLLIHRVEALADVARSSALYGLRLEVLRCLEAGRQPAGLDPVVLARLVRDLTAAGLLIGTDCGLQTTDAGRRALATGRFTIHSLERRSFSFLDNRVVQRSPHCLRVPGRGMPVTPAEPWEFDPDLLRAAGEQSAPWKEAFGFPREVTTVRLAAADDADWRTVVLDQAEHFFVVFVEIAANENRSGLRGFAVKIEGWALEANEPAVEVGPGWQEAFPDLATELSESEWRGAWQAWGQQRGLPADEMAACRLEGLKCLLRITASRKLMARLRETRSDVLKGETWLLAGPGRSRAAARVELVERDG